jgi:hypothetical protein
MSNKNQTQQFEQEVEEMEQTEGPTAVEKVQQFVEENREPIIRVACIVLGIGIGFGASYAIENNLFGWSEEEGDVIDMEDMEE